MAGEGGVVPVLAPPPKSPQNTAYTDTSPRFNPFDKFGSAQDAIPTTETAQPAELTRTDSQVVLYTYLRICNTLTVISTEYTNWDNLTSGNSANTSVR